MKNIANHNNYRSEHDEETAYDSYMNSEPGFRAGQGDSYDTALMAAFPFIATSASPPLGDSRGKRGRYRQLET